jgi:hypothetical protein
MITYRWQGEFGVAKISDVISTAMMTGECEANVSVWDDV